MVVQEREALQRRLEEFVTSPIEVNEKNNGEDANKLLHQTIQARRALVSEMLTCDCELQDGRVVIKKCLVFRDSKYLDGLPTCLSVVEDLDLGRCSSLKALPRGLSVDGNLNLGWCSALTELPEDLKVLGNLDLSACYALTALPRKLQVLGYLELAYCHALTALPENLEVRGNLNLGWCSGLTALPELSVSGDISLVNCDALTMLPRDLKVIGELDLSGCSALTALPSGIKVTNDLNLSRCSSLASLPEGLSVQGDLKLCSCSSLTALPEQFAVGGNLGLRCCSALTALPSNINLGGDLDLYGCTALTVFPESLKVPRDLAFGACSSVAVLPTELTVGGNLSISSGQALLELPKRLTAGSLTLLSSTLTAYPGNFEVAGELDLSQCKMLRSLPKRLTVDGSFSLAGCTRLTALPDGLNVKGSLNVNGCSALTALPARLSIGANLHLNGCPNLKSLPSQILSWPAPTANYKGNPPSNEKHHSVFLDRSGFSEDTLTWLAKVDAPYVRIKADLQRSTAEACSSLSFKTIAEAFSFWEHASAGRKGRQTACTSELRLSSAKTVIALQYLSELGNVKELGIAETRRALAERVMKVISLLNNVECRGAVIQCMKDTLDVCFDKPIWALNQLTLVGLISRACKNQDKLRALGRRVMNLQIVHEHVQKKIDAAHWLDEVCLYLCFETELHETLSLPVDSTSLEAPSHMKVTCAELKAVENEALGVSEEAFEEWLSSWVEWKCA